MKKASRIWSNICWPVAVIGTAFITSCGRISEKQSVQSVAVIPFIYTGTDPQQNFLADGFSDGVLSGLARRKGLKVTARASSFQFRNKDVDLKAVGKKLGVRYILKGRVDFNPRQVNVTAQLTDTEAGQVIWSEELSESVDHLFSIQNKIVADVGEKLEAGVSPGTGNHIPDNMAYELYLKGRASWNLRSPADLKKAIDFFQQAIERDPDYAAAYSGIADCYTALGYGSFLEPKQAFPKAFAAATKALKLDSTLAEPHASLGYYKFYYEWDWAAAEQEFRAAIARNANYELGYDWYGYYLTAMERYDEAAIILKKAGELDPLSVPIRTDMGFSIYYSGDYDRAINILHSSLQSNPKFTLAHLWLGRSYQAKKLYKQAITEYQKTLQFAVNWPVALAAIGNVYGQSGDKSNAKKVLDTLRSLAPKTFVTSYGIALVYAGMGEKDEAFVWLNKAVEERSNWLVWLKTDPRWGALRSDQRFIDLVVRIGLPK